MVSQASANEGYGHARIEAIDALGKFAVKSVVLFEGRSFSVSASVTVPLRTPGSPTASAPQLSSDGVGLAHTFRYTPAVSRQPGASFAPC